ncbi:MAG: PepSY domain-containing protein [Xanthomonadales bacterium]|nr:PepSY domain-containing protein [Xanthomonadales bacterium]
MNMAKIIRKTHRWAGLILGVQLLLWTVSGFYFALIPIEEIRGEHLAVSAKSFELASLESFQAPGLALNGFMSQHPTAVISSVSLAHMRGRDVYRIQALIDDKPHNRLIDARTGAPVAMMQAKEAELIASQLITFSAVADQVDFIEAADADAEFRGRVLPIYSLYYGDESNFNLYLDAWTGELVARRTTYWRIFDFLWMLHIMDYDDRSDFNNNLLRVFALSTVFFVISGFALWLVSSQWMRNRRLRKAKI